MKYIFVAGAPGSKWSSVAKNIYYSPNIDHSDSNSNRAYTAINGGVTHHGAYFDPGMEFEIPQDLNTISPNKLEEIFDSAFSGTGPRIIKSHHFCYEHNWQYLRRNWSNCPIVLVYRPNDACLGWWVRAGGFDIEYPNYSYYENFQRMYTAIEAQNAGLSRAKEILSPRFDPNNNHQLCRKLGISLPPPEYFQEYDLDDVNVSVVGY